MPNVSVNLPVPAGTGVGAWVDTSGLAPEKTIIVDNGPFTGQLFVELSNDGSSSAVSVEDVPIFENNRVFPFTATLQFMRVRRLGGTGSPTVSIAAAPSTTNLFGTLNVVNGGTGTATDLTLGGDVNTFEVSGNFTGLVFLEFSDDGSDFSSSVLFTVAGSRTFNAPITSVRVRTQSIVGDTPAVSVGSGSAASGGNGQGILTFDSINDLGRRLQEFDVTGFTVGATIAYVGNNLPEGDANSVCDYFRLALDDGFTPDGITIVSTPVSGFVWLRMMIPNMDFINAPFWSVREDASAENTGWGATQNQADAHPIPMAELRRRLNGSSYAFSPVIHQVGDITPATFTVLDTVKTANGNGFPVWLGQPVRIAGPITLTAVQPAVPATNTARSITGLNLGAGGNVGFMVQRADGGKTAFSSRSGGANVLEIGQVRTSVAATGQPGVVTDFIVGEVVNVFRLLELPAHPFSSDLMFCGVGEVEIAPDPPPSFDQGNLGGSFPFYVNVSMDRAVFAGGEFLVAANLLFRNHRASITGGEWQVQTSTILTAGEGLQLFGNAIYAQIDELLIQNSRLIVQATSMFTQSSGTGDLAIFNCAGEAVTGTEGASCRKTTGNTYGQGNTNFLFQFAGGATWTINGSQGTATSTAPVVEVAGRGYSFAQLPVADPGQGAFVTDPAQTTRRIASVNFTGSIATNNGATRTSYLANPGTVTAITAGNVALAQEYPTSKRKFEVLRAVKLVTGPGVACTLTLYTATPPAALAATGLTLSIPAADPVRTTYVITSATANLADGDTYALRLDSPSDGAPGTLAISATLE
jgi:hypothetical protein